MPTCASEVVYHTRRFCLEIHPSVCEAGATGYSVLTRRCACRESPAHNKMTPRQVSYLCAEWCVHKFREFEWAPLVGLVHDLGRLLRHPLCAALLLACNGHN